MEIYNNAYTKEEDALLWELHEIRHALHQELMQKTLEQINTEARNIYLDWQKQRKNRFGQFEQAFKTS